MNNKTEFKFGDYAIIEQKRHGVPNEMFVHKVIDQLRSNTWVDVPVQSPATETIHDEMEDVCLCICCGVDETEVRRYRVKDMRRHSPVSAVTDEKKGSTITLQAVNELIASLESAGELSIREQKFLKLAKEFRICSASLDAAIKTGNMLADQNAQLAAENVGLKAGRKFFMYSDDSGFETFETQEEAIKAAHEMIDACREDAYDGWPEEADTIRWGVVIQQATETDFEKPAPENGWEGSSDYKLLPEVPATDRIVAGIKADGVEEFAALTEKVADEEEFYDNGESAESLKYTAKQARLFAKQLREGAK